MLEGNVCALLAAKDHVNVFLYERTMVPGPDRVITAGHHNETARTVAVYPGRPSTRWPSPAMFGQIIADNRAGGGRKVKREP